MTTLSLPRSSIAAASALDWRKILYWIPLALILTAQAVLSARLMVGQQAGPDEARYIIAGHQLI